MAARKLHVNVCHIEAGLRSGDERMPEEINRLVTDRLSNLPCEITKYIFNRVCCSPPTDSPQKTFAKKASLKRKFSSSATS